MSITHKIKQENNEGRVIEWSLGIDLQGQVTLYANDQGVLSVDSDNDCLMLWCDPDIIDEMRNSQYIRVRKEYE